jgi:hypothetical protein
MYTIAKSKWTPFAAPQSYTKQSTDMIGLYNNRITAFNIRAKLFIQ